MTRLDLTLPFDRIVLLGDSSEEEVGIDYFMSLGLQERMKMILEQRVSFYSGSQVVLPIKALQGLYDSRKQSH